MLIHCYFGTIIHRLSYLISCVDIFAPVYVKSQVLVSYDRAVNVGYSLQGEKSKTVHENYCEALLPRR